MGLLQGLPTAEQLSSILALIMGGKAAGTGVAGVMHLLDQLDTTNLLASLALQEEPQ